MTGKPYSIKEMKAIVDYLTDNKLFGEIKGRKMWMDYAKSQLTTRTWQSLKETFIKRILPDIHNPYYKLSIEQINSFRTGIDVNAANKNKLEIHTVSDDSDGSQNVTPQTSNGDSKEKDDNAAEPTKSAKVTLRTRSSADTVIVDTCYETAEDIKKDLEETSDKIDNGPTKSLRDCITYSEPLTPMLQEVLDDFQSEPENEPESSDREYPLQIVETPDTENLENICNEVSKIIKDNKKNESEPPTKASELPRKVSENDIDLVANADDKVVEPKPMNENISNSVNDTGISEPTIEKESEIVCLNDSEDEKSVEANANTEAKKIETAEINKQPAEVLITTSETSSQILNNSTTPDASLPNNPEALHKRISNENQNENTEINDKHVEKSEKSENRNDKTELLDKNSETSAKVSKKISNTKKVPTIKENNMLKVEHKKIKARSECETKSVVKTVGKTKARSVEPVDKTNGPDVDNKRAKKHARIDVTEKPSTSKDDSVRKTLEESKSKSDKNNKVDKSLEEDNPCLNNLSLFNETNYNLDSSDIDESQTTNKNNKNTEIHDKQNDIVELKSHTESDDSWGNMKSPPKKRRAGVAPVNLERDSKIANVFGVHSGASKRLKHKRMISHRRRTISHNRILHNNGDSDSSDWTSESDGDQYISPPRGRRNRQTKKYLKPRSARIHSLEEEGGLFVMYGKKIYPVVKDGKLVKNYLTYLPDSESDEETYWKLKYVEEKKKAAELSKKLQQQQLPKVVTANTSAQTSGMSPVCRDQTRMSNNFGREIYVPPHEEKRVEPRPVIPESIKIKFTTKNDQEIHLEGNWPQLQNALEHVVHIFHKEPQPYSEKHARVHTRASSSSCIPSPVFITAIEESEVREKVNKIESEIFKEIEEMAMQEQEQPDEPENVTKRKIKPQKLSSPAAESPPKRTKLSDQREDEVQNGQDNNLDNAISEINDTSKNVNDSHEIGKQVDDKPADIQSNASEESMRQKLRTPRKVSNELNNSSDTNTIQRRRTRNNPDESAATVNKDEDDVRYMLPPEKNKQTIKSTDRKINQKLRKSLINQPPALRSSPEISCANSMESTQGYQDSDPSPVKNEHRKKKRLNIAAVNKSRNINQLRRSARNKQTKFLYYNDSSVSNDKNTNGDNSTINTEVYRSESYQLLMPSSVDAYKAKQELSPINETQLNSNDNVIIKRLDSTVSNEVYSVQVTDRNRDCAQSNSDIGSSSSMSLPLSPELSVVESLSISQELLNTIDEEPVLNEIRCDDNAPKDCSQYLMSGIDASIPLMQQASTLENRRASKEGSLDLPKSVVTESLLKKVNKVSIKDKSNLTDLDLKLRDLLLDSAKKIAKNNVPEKTDDNMEVDDTNIENHKQNNKAKQKKRCSTPRKRNDSKNVKKASKIQDLIEAEHTESYSQNGRNSCPPIVETFPIVADIEDEEEILINNLLNTERVEPKNKRKKDIIRVKITKPVPKKSHHKKHKKDLIKDNITESICNDIALNDSESGVFLTADDSVDLIHNHSETCLQANECVSESVEFVEDPMKSILTVTDSSQNEDAISWHSQCAFNDVDNTSLDFLCSDARDMQSFNKVNQDAANTSDSVCRSPRDNHGASSLMTDDLSDDLPLPPVRPDKWYLLSDDETTQNVINTRVTTNSGVGANLKQIFPIACAVPDLSTITEGSRDDDSCQKSTREVLSFRGTSSQSIFDSM